MKRVIPGLALLLLLGCSPFSGPLPNGAQPPAVFVQHVPSQGDFSYSIDLGAKQKSVYFAFTNPDPLNSASSLPKVSGSELGGGRSIGQYPAFPGRAVKSAIAPTPDRITEFNANPFSGGRARLQSLGKSQLPIPPAPSLDSEGGAGSFYESLVSIPAHCRKVVSSIDIGGDTRTLNIWVADNCWIVGGDRVDLVTQPMVDALAIEFLQGGLQNDIYDWVTAIAGAEWGQYSYSDVIPFNKEITIFLCDIGQDNSPNGGVIGYFWAKDNFLDSYVYNAQSFPYHSNQRIMFYIDAVMFANPSPPGYWAGETYSTLAHEFQHMINFNQKILVQSAPQGTDTWINEMSSQMVEDLVADKIGVIGPRGVSGSDGTAGSPSNAEGRLPLFNSYHNVSLSNWGYSGALQSYSATYAFGAYLLRNFGGAALLKSMVQNAKTDSTQIVDAISATAGKSETLDDLIEKWGLAVLLSDHTDAPLGYLYNTGNFFSSAVGSASYEVGSVNFFNYVQYDNPQKTGPALYTGNGSVGSTNPLPASGTLYMAGTDVTGKHDWSIELPKGVKISVAVK